MGTTLAFLCTDAAVSKSFLRKVLADEIESTFNRVSVDGDTSTNDSVFLMASGAAKNKPIESDGGGGKGEAFRQAVHDTLADLARQIVRDGEGANHVVTIEVLGAPSSDAAEVVARRIAYSPLCKTAFFGADPNWGRIIAAVGNCGLDIDHDKIDVAVGEVELVRNSVGLGEEAEKRVHEVMRRGEYILRVHLHAGRGTATHTTCDLTVDYVKLNADYRS
jgi:glutamate N-acetyltransferase/amino-acid N-acetyltransferase